MIRLPPRSTRTDTLLPYTTLFRSWVNRDTGNAHTATAYHPANFDRPRRVPPGADGWDSDYLLPGEGFALTLTVPGVYDYYCIPHEHVGMVGRIIVGEPGPGRWMDKSEQRSVGKECVSTCRSRGSPCQ